MILEYNVGSIRFSMISFCSNVCEAERWDRNPNSNDRLTVVVQTRTPQLLSGTYIQEANQIASEKHHEIGSEMVWNRNPDSKNRLAVVVQTRTPHLLSGIRYQKPNQIYWLKYYEIGLQMLWDHIPNRNDRFQSSSKHGHPTSLQNTISKTKANCFIKKSWNWFTNVVKPQSKRQRPVNSRRPIPWDVRSIRPRLG